MPYMPMEVAKALRVRLESGSDYDQDPTTKHDRCMECHGVQKEDFTSKRFPHLRDCIQGLIERWVFRHTKTGGA